MEEVEGKAQAPPRSLPGRALSSASGSPLSQALEVLEFAAARTAATRTSGVASSRETSTSLVPTTKQTLRDLERVEFIERSAPAPQLRRVPVSDAACSPLPHRERRAGTRVTVLIAAMEKKVLSPPMYEIVSRLVEYPELDIVALSEAVLLEASPDEWCASSAEAV